eukprot:13164195-Alexandrium_andersonii.AAC.1
MRLSQDAQPRPGVRPLQPNAAAVIQPLRRDETLDRLSLGELRLLPGEPHSRPSVSASASRVVGRRRVVRGRPGRRGR